ncbi:MAG: RluA family pseudouridine synthase [Planctomycetota bacterium]
MSDEGQRLRVDREDAGLPVERFLARALDRGIDHAQKLVRQGRVRLERAGRPARRGEVLEAGETLRLLPAERPAGPFAAPPQPNRRLRLSVLHEDPALLVLDKAAGVPVHPGPGHGTDTLLNALVARCPELLELGAEREYGLVHRLDLGTSGVLVVARTAAAYAWLREAFAERRVHKRYLALCRGAPRDEEGEVEGEVAGKPARTRYRVLEVRGEVGLLELEPETGRTHQLRIHLAALGCPVLGDARYGTGRDELTARLYLTRMALHAAELRLEHPDGSGEVGWESKLPRALSKAWKRAGS